MMYRDKKARHRMILAWVLLLSLTPFFVVKTLHHHPQSKATATHTFDAHSSSIEKVCPICIAFLSPFVESVSIELQNVEIYIRPFVANYIDKEVDTSIYSYQLRAPPILSTLI